MSENTNTEFTGPFSFSLSGLDAQGNPVTVKTFTGDAEDVGLIARKAIDRVSPRRKPGRKPAAATAEALAE